MHGLGILAIAPTDECISAMKNTLHKDFNKMTKPLGYYCALTPGDGSYLDHLQNTYGSCLEGINRIEKLHFLKAITDNLIAAEVATQGQYLLSESAQTIQKLQDDLYQYTPIGDHLGLAEAIINQLKYQR